jgi:hypothetical protein
MRIFRLVFIILFLTFVLITGSTPAYAEEGGEALVAGGLVVLASMIYDIATAPQSARRYNEANFTALQLPKVKRHASLNYDFGQPRFNRSALVDMQELTITYINQPEPKKKSPKTAFLLSLGLTVAPMSLGYLLAASDSENKVWGGVLLSFGEIVGPSTGHFYAHKIGRGSASALLRLGVSMLAVALTDFGD